MLPVVGDDGEVLDVGDLVVVEVAFAGGGGGFLPVVGDDGQVLDIDDAVVVGVADVVERDDERIGVDGLAACGGQA